MKAAIVVEAGKTPIYGDFKEPVPADGEVQVTVSAAALSNLVKTRASGRHYSSSGRLPFVVGVEAWDDSTMAAGCISRFRLRPSAAWRKRLSSGLLSAFFYRAIWTMSLPPPSRIPACRHGLRSRNAPGSPPVKSFLSMDQPARPAVQIARHMGAKKVVATGRNTETLKALSALGADVTIPLEDGGDARDEALMEQFSGDGIDVVLDYLWGPSAERILAAGARAGKDAAPIRFVHIGAVTAPNMTLPSAALRSSAITLMGSGMGSLAIEGIMKSTDELLQATVSSGFQIATKTYPLSDVEQVWTTAEGAPRIVFQLP